MMASVYLIFLVKDPIKDEQKPISKKEDWHKVMLKPMTEIKIVFCNNRPLVMKMAVLFLMIIYNLQMLASQVLLFKHKNERD